MKKVLIILCVLLFISCDKYRKDVIVGKYIQGDTYYSLRIFEKFTFFNNGAIKIYTLEGEQITEKNIDSINVEADNFIKLLNKKVN
jgi:hypothetical protein